MNISLEMKGFSRMVESLSKLSGRDYEDVLIDQVGQLLRVCIQQTHKAEKGKLKKVAEVQNTNASIKGGPKLSPKWLIDPGAKGLFSKRTVAAYRTSKRMPDAQWAKVLQLRAILEARQVDPNVAEGSRGLAAQSWYQIAKELGSLCEERAKSPAYIKKAKSFMGKQPSRVGRGRKISEGSSMVVEIRNASPRLIKGPSPGFKGDKSALMGRKILAYSMRRRVAAFVRELRKGVFEDMEVRAKRYPGIFTK